ncbi:pseudaminic acid synthase [Pseudoalteromonas viridis]|uniref:Pseudaminic acid synthase n=1 Tax=Pseudoalteromonas viridis TaxID=339617 RepID=A0ABX7V3E6_9GAMM|nr:pseudaminic acid synthase [Pseudoalteromonas viridis]QTL34227.1 pseudaminic acid synthase [Pseudoalteromonas viridis]
MKINDTCIGEDFPCYIIAEMSANHGGDLNNAFKLLKAAKEAGANAVKLQTYTADTITLNSTKEDFTLPGDNPWEAHKTLYSLYEKAYTPWEWHDALFEEGKRLGLDIFSSPFDDSAVELLESLGAPAYKIASPEITDVALLKRVAQTKKPVILSTGIANYADIELAVSVLRDNGCEQLAILKCTTAYPTPFAECNLRTIPDLKAAFNCVAGLSDHTLGIVAPVAAVTLGAKIIEKHFVLDKADDSVDAFFSLDQSEFALLVSSVRQCESALGKVSYEISASAQKNMLARRSLYFCRNLSAGDVISRDDIRSVRPGFGAHPKYLEQYIGQVLDVSVELGDRVSPSVIVGDIKE